MSAKADPNPARKTRERVLNFYCFDDKEYNYVILIDDSDTAVLIGNNVSKRTARECFERLTFEVVD